MIAFIMFCIVNVTESQVALQLNIKTDKNQFALQVETIGYRIHETTP